MRSLIVATAVLVFAAHLDAQQTATTTTTAGDGTAPPLIKTVADDPNDSPMVRAAKRAVKARQNPTQRRVVSLSTSGAATTRGRVAVSSGPAEGPKLPPVPSDAKTVTAPRVLSPQDAAARQQAETQEKMRKLQAEEERIRPELDEQYGHEMDEDQVDQRLTEIEAERRKLETPPPPPR